MKTNEKLQEDVQNALKWEPLLHAAEIGVTVNNGVVHLSGTVDSYSKKLEAETATKNVTGVKAVVEEIKVHFGSNWNRTSDEIAQAIVTALKDNWLISADKVKVTVEDGWVTFTGSLPWHYQKMSAEGSVKNLYGVKGVTNNITIEPDIEEEIETENVENALARSWWVNDADITVSVEDHEVTLSGSVSSFYQKDEAGAIAWKTPGIASVNNELSVDWD
jgi:osmotically-inducible protein OsmY